MNRNMQLELFTSKDRAQVKQDYSSSFVKNMGLPVHKWYRYTAGFSAEWVKELIISEKVNGRCNIIDPFAGSGTVLLESEFQHVNSIGLEAHPHVYKIAKTKLNWDFNPNIFKERALQFLEQAKYSNNKISDYPNLIVRCFTTPVLEKLDALKQTWVKFVAEDEMKDFLWFIITSILRPCSYVATAQWQYIQPNKTKSKVLDPFNAFEAKVSELYLDMLDMQKIN